MAQTINMKADGSFEINFGNCAIQGSTNDEFLPAQLLVKTRVIHDTVNASGISELHVEKDGFKEFEHAVVAGTATPHDFGTHVTEEEFEAIMALSELSY